MNVTPATGGMQLYLNSKYAAMKPNNGDTGFCIFEFPQIVLPDGNYVFLSLVSATIPYSFYSFNANNSSLSFHDASGSDYNFEVPYGNYNIYQLRTAILGELGAGWDMSYNAVTNKVTFSSIYDFSMNVASMNHALGFSETEAQGSTSKMLTSTGGINLNQIRAINFEIDMPATTMNVAQPLNQNILATIPVVTQPYGMIQYENPNQFRINMYCGQMNMVKVKFIDNQGNLINMNGVNWQATLQIDVQQFADETF